jgi:UrcA family protein
MFLKGFTRFSILTLAACGAAVLNPAAADVPSDVPSVTVSYSDLDLNARDGVTALYYRLRVAAGGVCTPFKSSELLLKQRYDQCRSTALGNAVAKVNNPALTAFYAQTTHSSTQPVAIAKN